MGIWSVKCHVSRCDVPDDTAIFIYKYGQKEASILVAALSFHCLVVATEFSARNLGGELG